MIAVLKNQNKETAFQKGIKYCANSSSGAIIR